MKTSYVFKPISAYQGTSTTGYQRKMVARFSKICSIKSKTLILFSYEMLIYLRSCYSIDRSFLILTKFDCSIINGCYYIISLSLLHLILALKTILAKWLNLLLLVFVFLTSFLYHCAIYFDLVDSNDVDMTPLPHSFSMDASYYYIYVYIIIYIYRMLVCMHTLRVYVSMYIYDTAPPVLWLIHLH